MPTLLIVVGSTRPGRVGAPVADWVHDRATAHGGFDVEVADLAALDLPFLDEPQHPRLGRYEHEHTRRWSGVVDVADAFVFVTPEYNHGFSAPLKNAIDYLHDEWAHKAVALVSYGGVSGGIRAAEMLKPVLAALGMVPAADVPIPFVQGRLHDGALQADAIMDDAVDAMLGELARWVEALAPLRAAA